MAAVGRPPKPIEVKRRIGNPGRRPLPTLAAVVSIRPASRVAPETLGLAGRAFYEAVLEEASGWIGATDRWLLEDVAALTDMLAALRDAAVPNVQEIRETMALRWKGLSDLGLSVTARSRLGVAEVNAASKLELLRRQQSARKV